MKKLFIVLSIILSLSLTTTQAQRHISQAVDFETTDIHGNKIHLFELLDQGKYVLIDFFYASCGPCQATAPKVNESYINFGCNSAELYVMSISTKDNNQICEDFDTSFGVEFPTISGIEGNGIQINADYHIAQYPTVILIAPDKTVVEEDIWPIGTAETLNNIIAKYGIEPAACAPTGIKEDMGMSKMMIYPNPSQELITLSFKPNSTGIHQLNIYNTQGQKVYHEELAIANTSESNHQIQLEGLVQGMYFIELNDGKEIVSKEKLIIMK